MFCRSIALFLLSLTMFSCGPGEVTVMNNAEDPQSTKDPKPNIPTKKMDVAKAEMSRDMSPLKPSDMAASDVPKADMGKDMQTTGPMYTPCGPAHDSAKFADMCVGIDQVLVDKMPKLSWVNASHGCKLDMMFSAATRNLAGAIQYCSDLNFAGTNDWRLPTQDELSNLIIQSIADDVHLNYANKTCKIVIATDGYVLTEHVVSVGRQPGEKSPVASRFGVRCVRDLE